MAVEFADLDFVGLVLPVAAALEHAGRAVEQESMSKYGRPGWFATFAADRLAAAAAATIGTNMRIEIQLRIVGDDDSVISTDEVLYLDKSDDKLEAIGLALSEAKGVLAPPRSAWLPPRRRASWPDIGAVTAAVAPC